MKVAKLLHQDETIDEVDPAEDWDLKRMQEFVDGSIEIVRSRLPHRSLVVNEDGLYRKDLEVNEQATKLVHQSVLCYSVRGNALLVKS